MSSPEDSAFVAILSRSSRVLLVQKWSGRWGLPGGGIETGETAREAVLRELKEETGLVGRGASLVARRKRAKGRVYLFVLPKRRTRGTLLGPTTEIRRQRWFSLRDAMGVLTPRHESRLRRILDGADRAVAAS